MLRLWLYLAGVEASTSNYKSVEEVHAALVIPGMHEIIVVMSGLFYPYVDQVCTQLSAQLLIQCMSNLFEYRSSQTSPFWKRVSFNDGRDEDFSSTILIIYSSLTIFLSRLTRFWMHVLSVMSLPPRFIKTTSVLHFVELVLKFSTC